MNQEMQYVTVEDRRSEVEDDGYKRLTLKEIPKGIVWTVDSMEEFTWMNPSTAKAKPLISARCSHEDLKVRFILPDNVYEEVSKLLKQGCIVDSLRFGFGKKEGTKIGYKFE